MNTKPETDLIVDSTWERCVGLCVATCVWQDSYVQCQREFISRERFDEHIAPKLRDLTAANAEVERYRKALEKIEDFTNGYGDVAGVVYRIAREALAGNQKEKQT